MDSNQNYPATLSIVKHHIRDTVVEAHVRGGVGVVLCAVFDRLSTPGKTMRSSIVDHGTLYHAVALRYR
jgi:hypothetical protein